MKKLLQYIPLQVSVFLIAGIIVGYYFNFSIVYLLTSIAVFALFLIALYFYARHSFKRNCLFLICTSLLFVNVGIFNVVIHQEQRYANHYSHFLESINTMTLVVSEVLKPTTYHHKYKAKIVSINHKNTFGSVLVNLQKDTLQTTFEVDAILYVKEPLQLISGAKNPYGFDYQGYLKRQQVFHQISLKKGHYLLSIYKQKSIRGYASIFRKKINLAIQKYAFDKEVIAIINAMLLGQRQELTVKVRQDYANAGVLHILAVSGLHVGIIMLLLSFLLSPLLRFKKGTTIRLVFIIILLWLFAFVAGLSASVVRSVTMFTAIAIGLFSGKKMKTIYTVIISLFFLLLFNPMFVFDVGFQLSYMAVFSIILIQPIFAKLWKPKLKLNAYFWNIFTVSTAAQLGVLPLSIYYFHQFPILFFVSNLIIIPFLGMILGLGILVIILALSNALPLFLTQGYNTIILLLNQFIAYIATKETFVLKQLTLPLVLVFIVYGVLFSAVGYVKTKAYRWLVLCFSLVVVFFGFAVFQKQNIAKQKQWIVFHKSKQTILGEREGDKLFIFSSEADSILQKNRSIIDYKIGAKLNEISFSQLKTKKQIFKVFGKSVLIVDSLGVYKISGFKPSIILLRQSPKINLTRLINVLEPALIIADGSNYTSYVNTWRAICKQQKTPFHATSKKGAYVLEKE